MTTPDLFRPVQKEPCKQCPFRRKSMPGWLGANSPEEMVNGIMSEVPLPCHSTIDYRKRDWAEKWFARKIGKLCMGARIFSANCAKKPRPTSLLPVVEQNTELVFTTPQEFVAHHRSLGRGSWEL